MPAAYDAVLLLSFGGPESLEDVRPFLENVVRGRRVPEARLQLVGEHYRLFGGKSPINDRCRTILEALRQELARDGPPLAVYWGNRNWHPLLADTLRQMAADGVRRALAFVTSAFGSYSGCRQYLEDIERARAQVGERAPVVEKLRGFHNHPGYVEPLVENVLAACGRVPAECRAGARLVFTAHSIPCAMAATSPYEAQLRETAGLVAAAAGREEWTLAYQSRSGEPGQPWLEPDILDHVRALATSGATHVVLAPIGFVLDNLEVVYDLDVAARDEAARLGLALVRAATAGSHPRFVRLVRELVLERISARPLRQVVGLGDVPPDACAAACCRPPSSGRPATPAPAQE